MSITILLEIGHEASLRSKTTPEGFTHDWEVFVRGFNGANIHYYVEKVVFHLHETFPKPKRVVNEPPYSLRTSGYAGFNLPIEIYLRNNQEPKKIKFTYDLCLQPTGPPIHRLEKEKYTFFNPSEEFESKLLKGGAVVGSGSNFLDSSDSSKVNEKNQMTSKPKLSGTDVATKKHRFKPEEPRNTDFENLFGPPIKKTSRAPEQPKPKDVPKSSSNSDKVTEKDKIDKSKTKSLHKDKDKEKSKEKPPDNADKRKEEKKKSKDDKNKERDKAKDKSSKKDRDKDKEREKSPAHKPKSPSPKRSPKRASSPAPVQKHSSNKDKDQAKEDRKDKDKDKDKERSKEEKKSKKDKREHKDTKHRDKDREKDHKSRERKSSKEKEATNHKVKEVSPVAVPPVSSQSSVSSHKQDKRVKEKDPPAQPPPPPPKEEEKGRDDASAAASEERQRHRHKKKERRERRDERHPRGEKRVEKREGGKEAPAPPPSAPAPVTSSREADKSHLFGSPRSGSSSPPKEPEVKAESVPVRSRDDDSSNESGKISSREASPIPKALSPASLPSPVVIEPVKKPEPEKKKEESAKKKERKERKKDKKGDKDQERKRKRKSDQTVAETDQPPVKIAKENNNSDDESKVSSTEDANAVVMMQPKSEYDMDMLRELQQKIMSLKDNADLQKVVQLIAETGQYEVSAHTFDFDLCLLDRSTVRQLQEFFSTIS